MSFKPRLVGNRPVPSPSRQEIWKQQLGLTGQYRHIDMLVQIRIDCAPKIAFISLPINLNMCFGCSKEPSH